MLSYLDLEKYKLERHILKKDQPFTYKLENNIIKQMPQFEKSYLIIDTLRSCYLPDTCDEKEIISILYPLQALSRKYNLATILLHHNAKGTDAYSGTTAIAGACDYMWNWSREKNKSFHAVLELTGQRGDPQEPMNFHFDKELNTELVISVLVSIVYKVLVGFVAFH